MITTLCILPLVGAVCCFLIGLRAPAAARPVALGFAVATLVAAIVAAIRFDKSGRGFQESVDVDWIQRIGVHWSLGLDGMAVLLVLLTAVLVPIVMLSAWRSHDHGWFAWALALESFGLIVFCATDVFLFYVFFEATLIPAYFMIGGWGGPKRAGAALKFLMYQLGGGLVLLGGVIGLYAVQDGSPSYRFADLQHVDISTASGRWIFVAFFIGFAVKAPLFPFHTWLADTTESATPQTSVLLVCVLDKIGTFGMLRYCLGLLPDASAWATPVVVTLCLISIVYGAFLAIGQDDILRLIGLTSLSHFGFIALGIFAFTSPARSEQGASGAILYMVNHGVATAAMFLAAGYLIQRRGTASIRGIRGVEQGAPVLAGLLLVAGLATAGLPGLSQFVSEILVLIGAFDYHWWVGAVAVTGIVLAAIYVLWMYQRTMTGPPDIAVAEPVGATVAEPVEVPRARAVEIADLTRAEVAVLAPLVVALVLFGFYPAPLLDLANPVVTALQPALAAVVQ
ncbi:NADH-quinone oxidoreductase subunit M [Nocardioides sp. Iso805N]|uniref:NADH-quinone oxidoreductase subunit M n=1 Tax=Nocardioides sp. Iso805N TaxID=1283287 RepID=UPI00037422C9|nr:NADH-quinone oxidoreductase subunit M [Nocardioides sp. Iso805N]